jgi:hypothetical protein
MYTCTIYVNINAPTFGSALCDLNCQKCNSTVSPQSMLQCMLHSPHLLLETVTPTVLLSSLRLTSCLRREQSACASIFAKGLENQRETWEHTCMGV